MRHLLTCECGRQNPVSTSQAGETVMCECGRSLSAPKLRELRQLPPAPSEEAPQRGRAAWSRQQGVFFAAGLALLMLASLALALTTLQRAGLQTDPPVIVPDQLEGYLAEIDRNTPVQNLEVWRTEVIEEGLQREDDPHFVIHRRIATVLGWIMVVAGIGVVTGLGLIIASFIVRPAPARSRPGKASVR